MEDLLASVITITIYSFVALVGIVALIFLFFVLKRLFSKFLGSNQSATLGKDQVILQVKIPPSNEQKEKAMEDFLHSLHRILPDKSSLSLELASQNQFLSFYIVTNQAEKSSLESQLYAQYPDAELEEVSDYLPNFDQNCAFEKIQLKKHSIQPIKTYHNLEEDLLKSLSALLSKTEMDDKFFLQIALKKIGLKPWQRGLGTWYIQSLSKKYDAEGNPTPSFSKLSQDLYIGEIKLAYISQTHQNAALKLDSLSGLFKSLKSENNDVKRKRINSKSFKKHFINRNVNSGELWSAQELATIFHFPYKGNLVSNVVQTTSKRAPAPDILPFHGLVDAKEVSFFGETNYRNEKKIFGIKRVDRRRHLYVIGKTGSGKSKFLELLLISDILSNQGCCLLDPHGDLADEILKFVPKDRVKDVVYINPSDRNFPIGFNPLEPVEDFEVRQHLSTFFIAIFKKLFAATWNQRMEHMIRYITLALLETPDSNILGIPRILQDTGFRQRVIAQIKDPVVKNFWTNEFASWNQQFSAEAIVPIINKVGQFAANPVIRNMVGQKKNVLDFEKFMNTGKIVIINISKGKLGEENAALLGSMFITKIQQAALSRANIPEEQRRDFYFYVDEFQNFATDAFSSILSEARKYRLDLTIAHQYIAQLPDEVKATTFGNVGSIIVFPVGGDDAAYLAKEFAPIFSAEDMINLNLRDMYIKMSVDGKTTPPFSAKTINVPKPQTDYSTEILDHCRLTYGRNRVEVENEIANWTSSTNEFTTTQEGFPEPII